MKKRADNQSVKEIDRNVIEIIQKLNPTGRELFGLECYLAGIRAAGFAVESRTDNGQMK